MNFDATAFIVKKIEITDFFDLVRPNLQFLEKICSAKKIRNEITRQKLGKNKKAKSATIDNQ